MVKHRGRLFLLPSPIDDGGLESISPEATRIIHALDYFIVEKARTARRYISATKSGKKIDDLHISEMPEVDVPVNVIEEQLQPLLEGNDIGILSEAGLPAVADPGNRYAAKAHELGITVIPIAGPSSILMALMSSGLEGQRFTFHGYLSAKKEELNHQLKDLEKKADREDATQIWIETPYRNKQILDAVEKNLHADRWFCIAAGLGSSDGFVITRKVKEWKKRGWPEIHKVPAVFLLR